MYQNSLNFFLLSHIVSFLVLHYCQKYHTAQSKNSSGINNRIIQVHKQVHLHLHIQDSTERTQIIHKPKIFSVILWSSFNLKQFQNGKLNSLRVSATVLLGGKNPVVLEICEKISHQPPGLEIRINSLNANRLLLN